MSESSGGQEASGSWSRIFVGRIGVYTFVLNLGVMLFAVNQFVVATIMPTVVRDIGGVDYYTWTFSLFSVGAIVGSAAGGPLRDAFGVRYAYAGSGLMLCIGLAGSALAHDMPTLVAWRFVQGIGGGGIASMAYGLVAVMYPQELRGRILGVVSTVWGVATVAGPGFGGVFAEYGIWRGAFWTLVPLGLIFVAMAWRYIEGEGGHGKLSQLPYRRLVLLALAVLLLSATSLHASSLVRVGLIAASVSLTALAFFLDARAERTMFPRRATALLTEMGAGYWMIFLVSIVLTFVNTYTTFYLQVLHGVAPFTAGYLFAVQSFMWTAAALVVATWRGPLETLAIIMGATCVLIAAVAVAFAVVPGPVLAIAIAIGLSGAGIGLLNNPLIQRVIAAAPEEEKHVAGVSVQTVRNIGIAFGAATSGMVAAAAGLADGVPRHVVSHAMQWVYGVNVMFAALVFAMIVPLMAGRRARQAMVKD